MIGRSTVSRWFLALGGVLVFLAPFAERASAQRPERHPAGAMVLEANGAGRVNKLTDQDDRRLVSVIVELDEPSLAARTRPGARAVTARGARRRGLDVGTADARSYISHLRQRQGAVERMALAAVPEARIGHRLQVVLNAMTMVVPEDAVGGLERLPGVKAVYRDRKQQVQTTQSVSYISAPVLWSQMGGQGNAGEGVVIGIIDTGVWPEHPSLADPDPSGGAYQPPAGWNGAPCEFGSANPDDPAFACNNKVIAARRIMDTYDQFETLLPGEFASARDDAGHGTHMATTAAGNASVPSAIVGNNLGLATGVAPRARIAVYKVCGAQGCYASDAAAAVQQAVLDGVDVINYAVSGGSDPYADAVSLALLDAYDAGVFVATAAGNMGLGSLGHAEPWTATVGATTINRTFQSTLTVRAPGVAALTLTGTTITTGVSSFVPIVNASTAGDPYCAASSPAGTFAGKIVVCTRGGNTRSEKSFNVKQRGAVGMVLVNPTVQGVSTDSHFVPTVHLEKAAGDSLVAFLASRAGATASFTAGSAVTSPGDVLASFSSRGSGTQLLGISKPDLVAPGIQIVAGHAPSTATPVAGASGQLFMALEGTSVSSAHVAGAAALLKTLHPDWSPGQIQSALMMTATAIVKREDGVTAATSWEFGSGRVQLKTAGNPGLSISPAPGDFVAMKSHLWDVNYPSLFLPAMPGVMTVRRTVQNLENVPKSWTVQQYMPSDVTVTVPARIDVPANGSVSFDIVVNASTVPLMHVRQGWLAFFEVGGTRALQFPIMLSRLQSGVPILARCNPSTIVLNSTTTCSVTAENTTFTPASVTIYDTLPDGLTLVPGSVSNATAIGNAVAFQGVLAAALPGTIDVRPGPTNDGYLSLAPYYAPIACSGSCDDRTFVGDVPAGILFNGNVYTSITMSTNGTVQLGNTGTSSPANKPLPNATVPGNTLAPFWTDLHPAGTDGRGSGQLYAGYIALASGRTWLVLEWNNVAEKAGTAKYSFQVWLRVGGTVEDITYTYSKLEGNGAGGALTIGAQDGTGTIGDTYYHNGAGQFPGVGIYGDLIVSSPRPAPGGSHTITFQARGTARTSWTNCGVVLSNQDGSAGVSCIAGSVK
jgi:hypothetical protein